MKDTKTVRVKAMNALLLIFIEFGEIPMLYDIVNLVEFIDNTQMSMQRQKLQSK